MPPLSFAPGQRWHSLTEPELGLGLVELVDGREVVIAYPARDVVRRYSIEHAPLARARLTPGQRARGPAGGEFRIEEVVEEGALLVYRGEGRELSETELDAGLDVATPENRLRTGQVDDYRMFDLRQHALAVQHDMLASPARGFLGGRIELFDHQLSIARDVCERRRVRVLLADEVGLGKTIEALLILHRLLLSGRVERALVLVPPALVHQWLAEAYLRFNLLLRVIGRDAVDGATSEFEPEDLPDALVSAQLFVCPLGVEDTSPLLDGDWDMIVVDEAHHLEPGSADLTLVETLAARVDHLVLLSATPDRDGEMAHFRRLALLDPARFHDPEAYLDEAAKYRELADTAERLQGDEELLDADRVLLRERITSPDVEDLLAASAEDRVARSALLGRLLDLHGIGRVMFRNVRARIPGFPRRVPCPVELDTGDAERLRREFMHDLGQDDQFRLSHVGRDPRKVWLADFLASHPDEKVLVLCSTRGKAEGFAKALATPQREVARFHEKMSTIERDRQAAWFLAADGPQVLVSSAIGAEGRNFQVARNLVLLDLPLTADRLEQLIGRIDRIGQGDEVRVYAPVVPGTPQARLWRWYAEALSVFDRPWHGSPVIDREFGAELVAAALAEDDAPIAALIERGRRRNQQIVIELENGRDRLLELTSFDGEAARKLRATIAEAERSAELEEFMVEAFEGAGLDNEWLGQRSYALRAGADYHRPFPGFVGSEMAVTFDRATGISHPERALLTLDHPMVRDTLDTLLAHETGNASIAGLSGDEPGLLLEAVYVAEPTVPRELRGDRFFPPTPIRIVVDVAGAAVALAPGDARDRLRPADPALLEDAVIRDRLPDLIERARALAEPRGPELAAAARRRMLSELTPMISRLEELARVNPSVTAADLDAARAELTALDDGLAGVRIRLDGLRLLIVGG